MAFEGRRAANYSRGHRTRGFIWGHWLKVSNPLTDGRFVCTPAACCARSTAQRLPTKASHVPTRRGPRAVFSAWSPKW